MSNEFLPFDETAFDDGRVLVAEHGFRLATNNLACRAERMPMFTRPYPLRGLEDPVKPRRVCTVEPAWLGPWVVPSVVEQTIRVIGECDVERANVSVFLVNRTTGQEVGGGPLTNGDETFTRSIACNRGENVLWLRVECSTFEDPEYLPAGFDSWFGVERAPSFALVASTAAGIDVIPPMQFAFIGDVEVGSPVSATKAPEFGLRLTTDAGETFDFTVAYIETRNVFSGILPDKDNPVRAVCAVLWEEPTEAVPVTSLRSGPVYPSGEVLEPVKPIGIGAIEIRSLHFEQTKTIDLDTIGFAADTHFAQRPSATVFGARALTARGLHRARFPVIQFGMGSGTYLPVNDGDDGHSRAHYAERVNTQPSALVPLIYRCTAKLLRDLFPPGTDDAEVALNVAVPVAAFRRFNGETVSRYRVKIVTLTDDIAVGLPTEINAETTPLANVSQYAPTAPRLFRMAARSADSGCWSITAGRDLDRWAILRATTEPLTRDVADALDDEEVIGLVLERVDEDGNAEPTNGFDYIAIGEPTWWISEVL